MTSHLPPELPIDPSTEQITAFGSAPAAAVIAECLRVQREVPARSTAARIFGRSPLSDESRPWYVGALGELDVARRLEMLGPDWTVLHAVPIGTRGSDIDHVIVGSAGVFTINTKFHEDAKVWVGSRRLLVNGQRKDHLRNARYEADRVRRLLTTATGEDLPVSGLVVIVGAKEITVREQPADVRVLRATDLVRWLRRQKRRLEPEQIEKIAAIMSRRDTWTAAAAPPDNRPEFIALQREVVAAKGVRMLWAAGALLAVIGVAAPWAFDFSARVLGG
ncbi:NERD domain-containing protein [Microbacterium sp. HD4P20]|uniref:nuclease-related domain-containing protein n=1 Tax=Microbacterium sp. HD4P20 TaxID=2864874 RepID=UPI001C6403E4|nr:nuclease-related domain-containing protein [Microbacterium sp. HD4P20]MCP2637650.1 NERD domain-containing protein [Microbacterium sp. HD4P20]